MEATERIVEAYARYLRGLATIPNIRCDGQHEIALLAIDPALPTRRFHIEAGVAISSGLSASADADAPADRARAPRTRRSLDHFVKHKFAAEAVIRKLRDYGFEEGAYQKVIVTWDCTPAAKSAAAQAKIELWNFQSILREMEKRVGDRPGSFADDTIRLLALFAKAKLNGIASAKPRRATARLSIGQLWDSKDSREWDYYEGELYEAAVKPEIREIERELEKSGLRARIARMSAEAFVEFLREEYYKWKFPSRPQYLASVNALGKHGSDGGMDVVEKVRRSLVNRAYDSKGDAIRMLMGKHGGIHGLSMAGASGLLALVYPEEFGCVDALVTKALREIGAPDAMKVNPKDISIEEAEIIIEIMRVKALELNRAFGVNKWTTRRIDRVLWVGGH